MIVTNSADLESSSDFVSQCFQLSDLNQIRSVLVQEAIASKFITRLESKMKELNCQPLSETALEKLQSQLKDFESKGFKIIRNNSESISGVRAAIIKCPRNLIASEDLPIVNLEVFRTNKEAQAFAKCALSVNLWCENISIAYEYIQSLPNARQIWMNCSHGIIHPKIPFYNGQIVCEDADIRRKCLSDASTPTIQIADNIQFTTTFRCNTFQTVAIPFGETFAN